MSVSGPEKIAAASHPRKRSDIRQRWAGEDLILYDSSSGRLHILNNTAATVWALCDGGLSPTDISAQLRASFKIGAEVDPLPDVLKILNSFAEEHLLDATHGAHNEHLSMHRSNDSVVSREELA